MMNSNQPKFDGAKWRCAKCQSVLATIVKDDQFSLSTMEKTTVAALELPPGFTKDSQGVYLKPGKYLPLGRGASNQKRRGEITRFRENQLGNAIRKSDLASIGQSQMDLAQIARNKAEASSATTNAKPIRLHAADLPVSIQCVKPGCNHKARLTSIRALPNMAQRGGV